MAGRDETTRGGEDRRGMREWRQAWRGLLEEGKDEGQVKKEIKIRRKAT